MEQQQQQQQLQHFIHPNHPLLLNPDHDRRGRLCWGCWEPVHGPSYLDLATVVKNVMDTFIINHVRKYPLGCIIPCTQSILLFSFPNGEIMAKTYNLANANSAKNIKVNTLIGVLAATSTFTSHALL